MAFGFFKYLYRYFVDENASETTGQQPPPGKPPPGLAPLSSHQAVSAPNLSEDFLLGHVPVYDTNGCISAFIPRELTGVMVSHQQHPPQPTLPKENIARPAIHPTAPLYIRTPEGHFIPCSSPKYSPPLHRVRFSEPKAALAHAYGVSPQLSTKPIPPNDQPSKRPVALPPGLVSLPHSSKMPVPSREMGVDWDAWPDGHFEQDFDWDEVRATANLRTHWATKVNGGFRKGSDDSDTWEQGKRSTRQCMGIIKCDNSACQLVIRPQTTSQGISGQLLRRCQCQAVLSHIRCPVKSTLWTWHNGIHYENGGHHNHPQLTHILHLLPHEQAQFEALVSAHPTTGPLGLVVGVPGLHGPGESVADISEVLVNTDRVRKERQKLKLGSMGGGDGFIAEFAKFTAEHPGFVIYSQIGDVTVISMQTPFMAARLVKPTRLEGPVNGQVSDAAHGWWRERTSLLVISSCYCPELLCWVPGIFSYTNGASAEHYTYHFLALFQSIERECLARGIELTDEMLAGIVDFSEAERLGFEEAFVLFWLHRFDNHRTELSLRAVAKAILKGCVRHYRAGITRISHISGVIPPALMDAFVARAEGLLQAEDSLDFRDRARTLIRDFPKVESWLSWWLRDSHSSMLFVTERRMDSDVWDSLPASTNAEEAMHWKFYCAVGRDHALMEGLEGLCKVAAYFERVFNAAIRGVPIRYGQAEPWKVIAHHIGRTKPSRLQCHHNDRTHFSNLKTCECEHSSKRSTVRYSELL